MFDTIYVGLTGLTGFSAGLRNISNNVANVNSPGYKGTELQFADLFYRYEASADASGDRARLALGSGLYVGGTTTLFRQGDLRDTGNATDIAIDGNGFFILRRDGETLYTRNGQFTFDGDGFLVDRTTNARVAGVVDGSSLTDISIADRRTNPARATTVVEFRGELSLNDATFVVNDIPVLDASGSRNLLRATFTRISTEQREWSVRVQDAADHVLVEGEVIRFSTVTGDVDSFYNGVTFDFTPPGGQAQSVRFNLGVPGNGVTSTAGIDVPGPDSTITVASQDGFIAGALTQAEFDNDGTLVLSYSNGQTVRHTQVALAWFDFLQGLTRRGDTLFANESGQTPQIGTPRTSLFGRIAGGNLEASNIDLAQQFSELIIIQRGYQASSQVVSAANEMMQQLFDMDRAR